MVNIFWEKDHNITIDTWLQQFNINESDMPGFIHLGGDTTHKIGSKFILSDGTDIWIGEWSVGIGRFASSYTLLKAVDPIKIINGGYRYWEHKIESWEKTGYFYKVFIDRSQMEDKYIKLEGEQIIINNRINGAKFYKIKTNPIIRAYLPGTYGRTREEEVTAIMNIINGVKDSSIYYGLSDPNVAKVIIREYSLNRLISNVTY